MVQGRGDDAWSQCGRSRRGEQRIRCLESITNSMDMSLSKFWEIVKDRKPGVLQFMGSQRVGHN